MRFFVVGIFFLLVACGPTTPKKTSGPGVLTPEAMVAQVRAAGLQGNDLTVAPLRVFAELVKACARHKTPLTLCGEMAGRPLEAMALIGLGYRTLSMAPASVGPVKTMILGLHVGAVQQLVERFVRDGKGSLRTELMRFAEQNGIEI